MISSHDQRAEAKTTAAFHDLRATIDEYDLLRRVAARRRTLICLTFLTSSAAVWLCHGFLKFESAFARRIGERFYFAVIKKAATIEDDLVDLLRQESLRDCFADLLRGSEVGTRFAFAG